MLELGRPAEAVDPIARALEIGSPTDNWHAKARDALNIARLLAERNKE